LKKYCAVFSLEDGESIFLQIVFIYRTADGDIMFLLIAGVCGVTTHQTTADAFTTVLVLLCSKTGVVGSNPIPCVVIIQTNTR
jgi:hypothetical protein